MTGQEVKRIRQALGLSQQEFADRLGVHKVTLAKWETDAQGMRGPAERLIRLLGKAAKDNPKPRNPKGARKAPRRRARRRKATR
jgi:DNA-binding transcriptional regulator YiaG